jgi:hypothetical protein
MTDAAMAARAESVVLDKALPSANPLTRSKVR